MPGTNSLTVAALERIDEVCCRFEQALKQNTRPDLRDYLAEGEGTERAALLRELLSLEIDYRLRRKESVEWQDYVDLLPTDREIIEEVLAHTQPAGRSNTITAAHSATPQSPAKPIDESQLPERIGRYRLLKRIAAGGAGVVYRGFDEELQRDVAIKVPHRDLISAGQPAARFLTEARLVANLHHPAIVPVYDVGRTEQGQCYVVSKFMEGGDLGARIRVSHPALTESATIVARIAEGLHYAHTRKLVHRDIKPSNLFADADGLVSIGDFGAAAEGPSGRADGFVGTPAYMSPEQARCEGHLVDARTDIYSLGVVLYELLTGRRPFTSRDVKELLVDVIAHEPVAPRQINAEIPTELERITLKAMSKRASDRYQTAIELSDDLRAWLDGGSSESSASPDAKPAIVPKGLRSFEASDAEFFLQLLPGPRDRQGVPESLRFWQARIEERLPGRAFRVGVIYGPSGCGKSSLVKAGLLPRLAPNIRTVYVEASADSTEADLRQALRQVIDLQGDLPEIFRYLRHEHPTPVAKTLIVIDQFEQWLHSHPDIATAELVNILRQCDGVRSQCLLLVRDDFWMPLVRFMSELEVKLNEHDNTMAVDLFDIPHARKVLIGFGQAYERLPASRQQISRDQNRFLDEALRSLQQDGTVVPICLSLFAEMMKGEPWEPLTLRRAGGTDGLGVRFLNRSFCEPKSLPAYRSHAVAARRVLSDLLPEAGIEIRAHVRSEKKLLAASGYEDHVERFQELLQILDQNLRLVIPTGQQLETPVDESLELEIPVGSNAKRYYQLSHDFMVSPIREWVAQGQRQTRRGRAELCLAERTALWKRKPESRQLPGPVEWMQIRLFTDSRRWTNEQRTMLRQAARQSVMRIAVVASCLALLATFSWQAIGRIYARSALATIRRTDPDDLLEVIHDVEPLKRWLTPLIRSELDSSGANAEGRRNLSLALLPEDPQQAVLLCRELLDVEPRELVVIRNGIERYADPATKREVTDSLWSLLGDPTASADDRFRASCMLAGLAPQSPRWNEHAEDVVAWLLAKPIDKTSEWLSALRPASQYLLASLERAFLTTESNGDHQVAAGALASFLDGEDQVERMVELVKRARADQLPVLVETLREQGSLAITLLKRECQLEYAPTDSLLSSAEESPPEAALKLLEPAAGTVTNDYAFCQTLPLANLEHVVQELREHQYRPYRLRPYLHQGQYQVGGIWSRDNFEWAIEIGTTADEFAGYDLEYRGRKLKLDDVAAYYHDSQWKFVAIWSNAPHRSSDYRVSLAMPRDRWQVEFDRHSKDRFLPGTLQYAKGDSGQILMTQIWRRFTDRVLLDQRHAVNSERLEHSGVNYLPLDVSACLEWNPQPYGVILRANPYVDSRTVIAEHPSDLLSRQTELQGAGFRPVAISLDSGDGRADPQSVTIWQRTMPAGEARRRFAHIRSNVIITLLSLGETETALPFFRHAADPTLRSYLIQKIAESRVPMEIIHGCLRDSVLDVDIRQALLAGIGAVSRNAIPVEQRQAIVETMRQISQHDPDSGVHSAAAWVLTNWNVTPAAMEVHPGLPEGHRRWSVNSLGQTMIVLEFPEDYGNWSAEHPPRGHQFAIAATETTIRDFARFQPEHSYNRRIALDDDGPANNMSWYAAAEYCNWLSEREGIPEDEWCYRPNEAGEFAEGMKIAEGFLQRRGYRLPLAAEWLYAASAGVNTDFFFGTDPELISDYGWLASNSQGLLHSVGRLQPNLFGFFDFYGNVKEWSHSLDDDSANITQDVDGRRRSVMGGCYLHFAIHLRLNYAKHGNPPKLREARNGLRVARTVLPPPSPLPAGPRGGDGGGANPNE